MSRQFINYDSSGPRPPVPGQEEQQQYKMTDRPFINDPHRSMEISSSSSSSSPPTCLNWARTLSDLLDDMHGVKLFKEFAESEGKIHIDRLNFWFACEGLKGTADPEKTRKIILVIYRFLKKTGLQLPEDIRQRLKAAQKDDNIMLRPDIFDQMQADAEEIIRRTTYPNFLQSDLYFHEVQNYRSAIERNPAGLNATNSTTATSSSISESSSLFISRSSTLPTLHEEGDAPGAEEGAVGGFNDAARGSSTSISNKHPFSLTKDALMATQQRRLEMRVPGAPGYSSFNYASYNPVSRRDSELASQSSGRTDSDTMSMSSLSEGRQQHRRRHHPHSSAQDKKMPGKYSLPPPKDVEAQAIIPRTQQIDVKSKMLSPDQFYEQLVSKLRVLEMEQQRDEMLRFKLTEIEQHKNSKLFADAVHAKLLLDDDGNNQDILDKHVSRIWTDITPHRSPGNLSPGNPMFQRRKPHEMVAGGVFPQGSMRSSKSMPDSNMRKTQKWGSMNTDSGISLFSSDTMTMKQRDAMSISGSSSISGTSRSTVPIGTKMDKMTQQLEDARRSKRHHPPQPPLPLKNIEPPPLPAKNFPQTGPIAAPAASTVQELTTVVYSFCDGDVPYLIKIPSKEPTLKQFKDYLPKKGNYRFFFKTKCDDIDNPIIQEEMCNDTDILPLYEGKVMATVKSIN